jgi:hypothetical protein
MRWNSQTAYRFGDKVMKYSLTPAAETQRQHGEKPVRPEDGEDFLHRWLQDYHSAHDAEYIFQV